MLSTSARLLKLLSLLQSRRSWAGAELAERLEVDVRTVRRDVDRLRRLGYPVRAAPGVAGGYRLGAGAELPPLLLDDEEAVAVAIALRTAAGGTVAGIEETALRALGKLEQLLPTRLRRRVGALQSYTVSLVGTGGAVPAELLAQIAGACRDLERLRFEYTTRDETASRRTVEPYRLVHLGRRWYLVAFDLDRDDWRTFRVDRIGSRVSTERRFVPRKPPARDLGAYVAASVSAARDRYQAEIVLHGPIAQLRRRVPPSYGTLEVIDDETCLLRTGSDWLGGLAVYVAMIGVDFEVLEPLELVDEVRRLAERFARAHVPTRGNPQIMT
ncbi:MAG TPA: WYL domain-containing protein [Gaiellaceae bacterium]|nr:WYL domain-containing protein [Gaiellaceae bacterium]